MRQILYFLLTILCYTPVFGLESFTILDQHPHVILTKAPSYLAKDVSQAEAYEAFKQKLFTPMPTYAKSLGFFDETIWISLEIQNGCAQELFLNLYNLSLDHIEYFVYHKDEMIHQGVTGALVPIQERHIKTLDLRMPLLNIDEPLTYLIKIHTHNAMIVPIVMGTDGALQLFALPEIVAIGIFSGVFLALFLYNCILYIATKQRDYLLYSLYIFALFCFILSLKEYFLLLLQDHLVLRNPLKLISLQVASFLFIFFTLTFLNIQALSKKLYKATLYGNVLIFLLLSCMALGTFGHYLGLAGIMVTISISLFLGVFAMLQHNALAKYYLLAVGFFFTGSITTICMVLGVIDYSFSTSMPLLVGSMIEMLLFSLALGYKIKTLSLEHTKTLTQLQAQNKILFLQSRYTSVGELIRNITHQWKEPLGEIGAIQTNLKSTLVFQGSVSKEKLLNAINLSHKIISHLAETIDTFYRFFRAKTTESQEFDITTEIDNLRKMVNYTFDSDQIALTCTYSERPISIYGHPNEFAHAILNIILNAKDVLIKRQIKHPWVNIDVSTSSSKVFITVSDNGGGILQEPITKIFNAGVSSKEENIGIGLYIAKTIIEKKMQGRLMVKNSDVGAVFTISFPLVFSQDALPSDIPLEMEESAIERISQLEKDIERRIEVEKNLKQWAHIFEKAHWGIAICSVTHNTFDLINPEFARMHGFSIEELLNQPIEMVFEPYHRADIPEALLKVHKEGHYAFESEHLRKDGSTFPVDIDIIAVKSEDGELLYRIANVRDITLYKQTHERLLLKKFALNHIQDAVFLIDENADFCDVNEGACKALGYTLDELMSMNVGDIDPEWPKERWPEHWNELKKAGSMTMELRHKRKDGSIFPVEISANYIEFAGKTYNMSIVRDITERKVAQTELLLINKALNNTDEATYILLDEKITQVNDGACKMLGYSREELTSMSLYDIDPELTHEELKSIEALGDSTSSIRFERKHRTKDGNILDVEIVTNMFEHDGTAYAFVAVRDITEQKKATETLYLQKFALDTIIEAVYLIDENSMFHYVNDGACKALGYTKEEFLKLGVINIDPNCTQEWWKAHWAEIKEQSNMLIEATHRRKDGTIIPIEVSINYFEYNGVGYNLAVTRDISERLLLEQRKEDERMHLFFEKQLVGMAISSPEKSWLKVNDKLCTMLGYSQEELTNKTWSEITYPDDLEPDVTQFERVLRGEIEGFSIKKRFICKDGGILYTNLSTTCIRNTDGSASYFLTLIEDITEQTHAHEALTQKEQELRSLAESSPGMMGSFCLRPDGLMYMPYVSPNIIDIFGLHPEEVQNDATPLLALNHPDDAQRIHETILTSAQEMSVWHEEYRIIHPRKGERWMESNTKPERSANGDITWYGYVHDITERKKIEEKLQENQAHLLAIISTIPDKIWLKDKDGIYLMCNSAYERFLGASKEEIIGKTDYDFVTKEQGDFFRQKDAEAMVAGTMCINEEEVFQNNGQYAFLETRKVPVYNDKTLIGILGIGRDITERKKSELILDEIRQRLHYLIQSIPDPVWMKDVNGNFLACNHGVERLFNTKEEDIIGKDDYDFFEPELAEFYRNKDRAAVEADYVRINEELWTFRDNGEQALMETRKVPVKSADGTLLGTIGVARDITERKKIEEKLKKNEASLNKAQSIAKMGSWELDIANDTLTWSDETYRIFELDRNQTTNLHQTFYEIVHPDDREMVNRLYVESVEAKMPYEMPHRIVMRDGRIKYVLERCETQYDAEGKPILSIGTVQDITERHQMELSLKESNERYTQILNNSIDVIYLIEVTPEGRFIHLDINTAYVEATGIPREAIIGLPVEEIEHEAFRTILIDKFTTCLNAGEITNYTADYPFSSGIRTFHSVLAPIRDKNGRIVRIVGAARDVTEHKRMEKEIEKSYHFLNQIVDAIPDPIFVKDREHRWLLLNNANIALTGIDREMLLGKSDYDIFSKEEADIFWEKDEAVFSSGKVNINEEYFTSNDGTTHCIETVKSMFVSTDGNEYLVGTIRDISERKHAEETIKELNTTLEEKVKKRTLQLQEALEFSNGVINALPDLLFEIDLYGTYLNVWARDEELLATHKEHLLGHNVYDVLSPESANAVMEALKEANTTGVSFGKTIKIELPQGAMYFEESVSKKNSSNTFLVLSHDITERKKAELELREKEEKFSKLFKLSPAAISITSLERNMYLDVNDSFLHHTGYAYEEVVGKSSADLGLFVNPEERAAFFKKVLEDGYIKDFNYSFRAKDGRIGYAMAYASLITFKGERCLIGHSYDMSERKKIEALQHERLLLEERLSKIATAAPGVNYIFEKTVNGTLRFTYLSSGFTELFGISQEDALSDFSTTLEHIHSDDKESIRQSLPHSEKALSKWHEEFRIIHPEKGTLWIEGQSKPELQADGSVLWYGFFHDVTERKKAENALAKSEEAFRAIVENSPDVIARYDLNCKRIYVNPMMQLLIGKPLDEILGKTPREYSPLLDSATFEKLFDQVLKEKKEVVYESAYVTSTGEERFGQQRIIPEFDKAGEITSILVIGRDLADLKMAELELIKQKGTRTHE